MQTKTKNVGSVSRQARELKKQNGFGTSFEVVCSATCVVTMQSTHTIVNNGKVDTNSPSATDTENDQGKESKRERERRVRERGRERERERM